jgi:hypothetical protein
MNAAARLVIAIAAGGGLACAGAVAAVTAAVDNLAFDVNQSINDPTVASDLRAASVELHARDGTGSPLAEELMGIADLGSATAESLVEAGVHFRRALELRPVSPYTWANLAMQQYRTGDTGAVFRTSMTHAAELGPNEPPVQAMLADYGLAVFDEVPEANRQLIESAIARGMRRAPQYFLQIAQRRGRLDVACRHFERPTRQVDSKWVQICKSMEATS